MSDNIEKTIKLLMKAGLLPSKNKRKRRRNRRNRRRKNAQ
jgi:hypothetical protein